MNNTPLISKEERRVIAERWEEMTSMHKEVVTVHELRSLMIVCNVQPIHPIECYEKFLPGNGIPISFSGFLAIMENEKTSFLNQSSSDADLLDAYTAVGGSGDGHIDNSSALREICESFGLQIDLGNSIKLDSRSEDLTDGQKDLQDTNWTADQGLSFDDFTAILSGSFDDWEDTPQNVHLDCDSVRKHCSTLGWQESQITELIEDLDADHSNSIERDELQAAIQRRLRKLQTLGGGKIKLKPPVPTSTDRELLEYLAAVCSKLHSAELEQERIKKRYALEDSPPNLAAYKGVHKKKSRLRLTSLNSRLLMKQNMLPSVSKSTKGEGSEMDLSQVPSPFTKEEGYIPTSSSVGMDSAEFKEETGRRRYFQRIANSNHNGPPARERFRKIINYHPVAAEYKRSCAKDHSKIRSQLRLGMRTTVTRGRNPTGHWEHYIDQSNIPIYSLPQPNQLSLPPSSVPVNTTYLDDNGMAPINIDLPTQTHTHAEVPTSPMISHKPRAPRDKVVGRRKFVSTTADREKINKKIAKFDSSGKPRPPTERKLFDHYFGFIVPPRYAAQEMVKGQNDEFHGLMEFVPRSGPVMSSKSKTHIEEPRLSLESEDVTVPIQATRRPTLSTFKAFDTSKILHKLGLRPDTRKKGATTDNAVH
eukprot:TRINITY_DN22657_c0_g1_i1.p1 TRINITY_DN22657_c0_g1~~TRINITY_DN22657_c0_g1_i1.p1  ORF type:complete len:647 (+),score=106.19 TRINITY_DN22657_c0_g1_i1:161-2101(+)